jgi:hypothetical protein
MWDSGGGSPSLSFFSSRRMVTVCGRVAIIPAIAFDGVL